MMQQASRQKSEERINFVHPQRCRKKFKYSLWKGESRVCTLAFCCKNRNKQFLKRVRIEKDDHNIIGSASEAWGFAYKSPRSAHFLEELKFPCFKFFPWVLSFLPGSVGWFFPPQLWYSFRLSSQIRLHRSRICAQSFGQSIGWCPDGQLPFWTNNLPSALKIVTFSLFPKWFLHISDFGTCWFFDLFVLLLQNPLKIPWLIS